MKSIDFRISGYFPRMILFFGVLLAFIGVVVLRQHIFIGLILIMVSLIIFTTHCRLGIDFERKTFHDYVWIFGFKNGVKGKFEKLEYLFIKRGNVTQKMNNIVSSTTIRKEIYTGFLKFSDEEKIELLTTNSKAVLIRKLKTISTLLNLRIIDYSDGESVEI